MDYEIVKYENSYEDQICELEKELWSPDLNVNRSYLRWKYFDNPYAASSNMYMVLDGGKLIAARGMYATKWQLGNDADGFITPCGGDTVINNEYRNRGVYNELADFIKKDQHDLGYSYIFNFSASPKTLITSLSTGWKSIGRVRTMTLASRRSGVTRKLFSERVIKKLVRNARAAKFIKRLLNGFDYNKLLNSHRKVPANIRIDNKPCHDEMAALVSKRDNDNKLVLTRDQKFFEWRYSNPRSKYIFLYRFDDQLNGYLIAQTHAYYLDYLEHFNILELEAVDSSIELELLESMTSLFHSRSITIWSSMLSENGRNFLVKKGIIESGPSGSAAEYTPTVLLTKTKGSNNRIEYRGVDLLDINNWDLKMMYSDAY